MKRAYWSGDFGEAHVVAAMLQAHGLEAAVFDALLVRQDWFNTLVYGGYRIMVPESQVPAAREVLADYRTGTLALPDDGADAPPCPRCSGGIVMNDSRPRRAVFGGVIVAQAAPMILLLSPLWWWIAGLAQFLPLAASSLLASRHRCGNCGFAFGTPRLRFDSLARAVSDAEARSPQEAA